MLPSPRSLHGSSRLARKTAWPHLSRSMQDNFSAWREGRTSGNKWNEFRLMLNTAQVLVDAERVSLPVDQGRLS